MGDFTSPIAEDAACQQAGKRSRGDTKKYTISDFETGTEQGFWGEASLRHPFVYCFLPAMEHRRGQARNSMAYRAFVY